MVGWPEESHYNTNATQKSHVQYPKQQPPTEEHGGASLMFWGGVTYKGTGNLSTRQQPALVSLGAAHGTS